jgi:hypothetical protein
VNGGDPGKRARKILEKADGTTQIVGNKVEDLAVEAGDQLHFITWGGGGWGDPLERDPALVGKEIVQGWSRRKARAPMAWWPMPVARWTRPRHRPCARTCARSGRRLAGVQHRAGA